MSNVGRFLMGVLQLRIGLHIAACLVETEPNSVRFAFARLLEDLDILIEISVSYPLSFFESSILTSAFHVDDFQIRRKLRKSPAR